MIVERKMDFAGMRILVTGCAGFIGYSVSRRLLDLGVSVTGVDNMNDYYSLQLKRARLSQLTSYAKFDFRELDISDDGMVKDLFSGDFFDYVINLAAQAGVRYSIENPKTFIDSNLVGFFNVLEGCRKFRVKRLIYASSSSVYGGSTNYPYSTEENVNSPVSLYAATKVANELMAHSYYKLYDIPVTGLRLFTVYGPWGRPDMAYYLFTKGIYEGTPIKVFNNGNMERDYTYIDDIVNGIVSVIEKKGSTLSCEVYNLGNNRPVNLMDFISILEKKIGKEAMKINMGMQKGDVIKTAADISKSFTDLGYCPSVTLEEGLGRFVDWYIKYNGMMKDG